MTEVDIWEDEPLALPDPTELVEASIESTTEKIDASIIMPEVEGKQIVLTIDDGNIHLFSKQDLMTGYFLNLINFRKVQKINQTSQYLLRLTPLNAFVLRRALMGYKNIINPSDVQIMASEADKVPLPEAHLTEDGKHVEIVAPKIKFYTELLSKVNSYPTKTGYRVEIARVMDLETLSETTESRFPKIKFDRKVLQLNREPIVGFDGTLQSLKDIPIGSLNVVSANNQSWKALKGSKQTLEEKMQSLGINSLYDMLFWLPKRYIDKSKPQDISDLVEGETAVVVGKIDETHEITAGRGGAVFTVKTNTGNTIRTTFFNQKWLLSKFSVGNEVLVTGKFSWWNKKPQISGSSIEHAEEAAMLPIVPIYKQSPSKGITTYFLMASNRELLSRLGDIKLPPYFRQEGRMNYCEALSELHFPSSLAEHKKAVETLAYYELIHMQIIVQEAKEKSELRAGLVIPEGKRKLQAKGIKMMPFELTVSQKRAVVEMNSKLENHLPSSTLLSADVGAGKSAIAQLAALRAVDGGYQAVVIGPTDILARQLFEGFKKLLDKIEEKFGDHIPIIFINGSMKAKEKKEAFKKISDGEISIVVGTHSVMNSVTYNNLGFVAIDEQQKFGAEQRSKLLTSREDGAIPDIMMQTATPIPRSTAQVFYGDIDMIELAEKPPGRIPIVTEWIREDPNEMIEQITNKVWADIIEEAGKGNQTFIITPLVSESTKIDSASVERTYKSLQQMALSGLRIGFVHGQMKQDLQQQEMDKFRNKEYDVLVSSMVVEVGVDIPDATRVAILSADRLGSASLHQIRGRVGRNSKPSKCYLVSLGKTENSQIRLQSLVDSENGFDIAKADLELRGEGNMFSTEQSGRSEMIFANLAKHRDKINEAKEEAKRILKSPFKDAAIKDSKEKFQSEERII